MTPQEVQYALAAIVPETVQILDANGFQFHCIEAAALLTKTLQKVGISGSHQLTVGVKILNAAFQEFVKKNGVPQDETSRRAFNDAGAAAVVLGKGAENAQAGMWPGHLVVIVPGAFKANAALVDLTIAQANKPDWAIRLEPLCLKVTDDFLLGSRSASFEVNGSLLKYTAYPEDHSYGDWSHFMARQDIERAATEVVSRLG
jgi:diacylglycerol kinase